jgi:DNA modification methylase
MSEPPMKTPAAAKVLYRTARGAQLVGDSRELLGGMDDGSIDLIMTSPPFPLLRKKAYGNEDQEEYVDWLMEFGRAALPKLKATGSLVIDIGGAYQKGRPVRSLHQFRALIRFCDELGYHLAEEFYWHNPAKLPSPIEWVNKRKIRAKDSVNTVWWLSKAEEPCADVSQVLVEYSESMKRLLKNPEKYYQPKDRPSEHSISDRFGQDNGGAIPSNLLSYANSESTSTYQLALKMLGRSGHPARFPAELPSFFIKMLTKPGDLVVDIFSGSNTTGLVAEQLERRWVAMELDPHYAALSSVRFMGGWSDTSIKAAFERVETGREVVDLRREPEVPSLDLEVAATPTRS